MSSDNATFRMTPLERRASFSLAFIFALRMLGLFLVMPVFSLEAAKLPGGDNPAWVGFAMGIYGLTQGLLQLPYGIASDRMGRKIVIVFGLIVFAFGSLVAASASTVTELMLGRAIQGAGAVSAAVSALLADQTRDQVRTKAMALIGASIGLMFALSLVASSAITAAIGFSGLFVLTCVLAVAGIAVVLFWTPPEQLHRAAGPGPSVMSLLQQPALARLFFGVFVLHAVQLAMWMAIPQLLVQAGWVKDSHWQIYLPALLGSFVIMGGLLRLERKGYQRQLFLMAVSLFAVAQLGFFEQIQNPSAQILGACLFVFFIGFNILEATQPSRVSQLAPVNGRGTAMGIYNTLQSLGLFAGGALGGWIVKTGGANALFMSCFIAALVWLFILILDWKQSRV